MKKKIIILLLSIILLFSWHGKTIVEAVSSSLFKGIIYLNNKKVDIEQDVYSINGTVYVPLRKLATLLGSYVSYDPQDQSVYIEQMNQNYNVKSAVSKYDEKSLKLHVFSGKSTYVYGEPLQIWTSLSNSTHSSLEIDHSSQLISYSIIDKDGVEGTILGGLDLLTTTFLPDDELYSIFNPASIIMYNAMKNGFNSDLALVINEVVQPASLPIGEYTLKVNARYTVKGNGNTSDKSEQLEVNMPLIIK